MEETTCPITGEKNAFFNLKKYQQISINTLKNMCQL